MVSDGNLTAFSYFCEQKEIVWHISDNLTSIGVKS